MRAKMHKPEALSRGAERYPYLWLDTGAAQVGNIALSRGRCERIGGGEGLLSRSATVLQVLPTAAETDYGHDMGFPFFGLGSWPLRLSFSLKPELASGELSSAGGTIAEYCR